MENKLTMSDVLQSKEFKQKILTELKSINNKRLEASAKSKYGLKRSAYDSLVEKKLLNVKDLVTCYTLILTKSMKGLSSNERDMVRFICDPAFNRAANKLLAKQETADIK